MGKHTPGPWTAMEHLGAPEQRKYFVVNGPVGDHICRVWTPNDIIDGTSEGGVSIATQKRRSMPHNVATAEANSMLIAAAPELLEACKNALSLIKSYWIEEHVHPVVGLVRGELERTIDRAEGK